ncbi:nucleoside-diphosphate-sugar epimerase [Microbacterium resistens]|uniref:Nucleoside-diphosphate-sugar epimerase n=2 Tax=Microbacterium resistens TaxID=156977 RepID=A0ABU1S935_9MICO|nr:nucleoside-diphosphate-sugar epimerase [Microbacterium resistens]
MRDCDVLVHAASYLGEDPALQKATNVAGTEALLWEAKRVGVRTIISFSNTAVYGRTELSGQSVLQLRPDPLSLLSRTRLAADMLVAEAGGLILRTNVVYGRGDRLVVPSLVAFTRRLGALVDGGRSRISVIRADQLAAVVLGLVGRSSSEPVRGVLHTALPAPVTVRDVLTMAATPLAWTLPSVTVSAAEASAQRARSGVSAGQLAMVSQDRWVDSQEIWDLSGVQAPEGVALDDAAIQWYQQTVAE